MEITVGDMEELESVGLLVKAEDLTTASLVLAGIIKVGAKEWKNGLRSRSEVLNFLEFLSSVASEEAELATFEFSDSGTIVVEDSSHTATAVHLIKCKYRWSAQNMVSVLVRKRDSSSAVGLLMKRRKV